MKVTIQLQKMRDFLPRRMPHRVAPILSWYSGSFLENLDISDIARERERVWVCACFLYIQTATMWMNLILELLDLDIIFGYTVFG